MRLDWLDLAECKDAPTAVFFPERGGDVMHAKAFCQRCPVRDDCLAEHIDELVGIFGGLSGEERRRLRNRRRWAA